MPMLMGEIPKQQILDLLYEVADGVDRVDAQLGQNLALLKTINYEMKLGREQIAEARSRYSEKVSSP